MATDGSSENPPEVPLNQSSTTIWVTSPNEEDRPRKRAKYVAKACNRCKKQKTRCNGEEPCDQCAQRPDRICSYEPTESSRLDTTTTEHIHEKPRTEVNTVRSKVSGNSKQLSDLTAIVDSQAKKFDKLFDRLNNIEKSIVQSSMREANHAGLSPQVSHKSLTIPPQLESSPTKLPLLRGITSSSFYLKVIELSLEEVQNIDYSYNVRSSTMAVRPHTPFGMFLDQICTAVQDDFEEKDSIDPFLQRFTSFTPQNSPQSQLSPLEDLTSDEAERLVIVFDQILGMMFPILNLDDLLQLVRGIYHNLKPPKDQEIYTSATYNTTSLNKDDINIVKMVIAVALVAEGSRDDIMALKLYKSLQDEIDIKIWSSEVDLSGLILLILVAICHMVRDKWRLAWRIVGNLIRIITESKLHRYKVLVRNFPQKHEQEHAINVIWSVIVLDRQLSYGLGLPLSLPASDMDANFPEPIDSHYLRLMLEYSRIGYKACDALSQGVTPTTGYDDKLHDLPDFYIYQLEQWQDGFPDDMKFTYHDVSSLRRSRLIRSMLYLRGNHLKILIIRLTLCSNIGLKNNQKLSNTAVNVACDSIQVLIHLYKTGDFYQCLTSFFDYFLVTALGVILLVVLRAALQTRLSFNLDSNNHETSSVESTTLEAAHKGIENASTLLRKLLASSGPSRTVRRRWSHLLDLATRVDVLDVSAKTFYLGTEAFSIDTSEFSEIPAISEFNNASMTATLEWSKNGTRTEDISTEPWFGTDIGL